MADGSGQTEILITNPPTANQAIRAYARRSRSPGLPSGPRIRHSMRWLLSTTVRCRVTCSVYGNVEIQAVEAPRVGLEPTTLRL